MRNNRLISLASLLLTGAITITGCSGDTYSDGSESVSDATSASTASAVETESTDTPAVTETSAAETVEPAPEEQKEALPPSVQLSHTGGLYAEEFELTLTALEDGTVFYTTDGSDPRTSSTAAEYSAPLKITDREGAPNVVSAVDPVDIAGSFNKPNKSRDGFVSELTAPEDEDVDKCTVIRSAVKLPDGSFAGETSATYFIGDAEEHIEGLAESCAAAGTSLAVVSISMNFDDLFGSENGIYVKGDIFEEALVDFIAEEGRVRDGETARKLDANYKQRGREWERLAAMTMFEFDENGAVQVLNQNCGVRVQGNYSRSDVQKGLRLYARKEYGDNNFRYAVFGEDYVNDNGDTMDKFKTLVLRAGGNCAFLAKFNDTYWQSLLHDSACETKQSRPCVVYLNGEYWGLYVLEEDYSNDFFEDVHGVNKSNVVVYKGDAETYSLGYKLDEGDIPEGENEDYYFRELTDFFASHSDLRNQADYEDFIKLVDPDSVRDYFAVNVWINNKWDWPGKNWSMWKVTETEDGNPYGDGRWRFALYDIEFGGVSGGGDARTNTIKDDNYKPNGLLDMDTENPAVLCFAYLMTNEGWRSSFYDRLLVLSEAEFEKTAALDKLTEFEDSYGPLFDQFFKRYPETGSTEDALNGGYGSAACIRDFINQRSKNIQRMIDWCEKTLNK